MNDSLRNLIDVVRRVNDAYNRPIEQDGFRWILDNVNLAGAHQGQGEFSLENHGYMEQPLRAMLDENIKRLVIIKPSKTGGSTLADVCLPYWLTHTPAKTILMTWVGEDQAAKHAKDKLYPTLKASGIEMPIEKKLTKQGVDFPHCKLVVGGPAKKNFEDTDADILVMDEPHGYPKGRIQMGFNRILAAERETGFSKCVLISRAAEKDSQLEIWYKNGSQHVHHVPCLGPTCTGSFAPSFSPDRFKFDASSSLCKTDQGYQMSEINKTIRMVCPHCGHEHEDCPKLKRIWSNSRKYVCENSGSAADYRSYTWSPFVVDDWTGIVGQFLNANQGYKDSGGKDADDLIEFRQTRLAEFTYKKGSLSPDGEIKVWTSVPESWGNDTALRQMSIDVQTVQGVYWALIREFRKNADSQMLWYGQVVTESDLLTLQQKYEIPANCVFIDIGDSPATVSFPLMARNGWIGLKGDGNHDSYTLGVPAGTSYTSYISSWRKNTINNTEIRWLFFAKQPICDLTNVFLQKKSKVSWISLPNKEYSSQVKKVRRIEKEYNRVKRWVWGDDKSAHGWDCENMQVAGCLLHKNKIDIMDAISPYTKTKQGTGQYITRENMPQKLVFEETW